MYPIQNTDFAKCPYGFRAVIYADPSLSVYAGLKVINVSELLPNWYNTIAVRKLQGLPIMRKYSNFDGRDNYHQCVFASSNKYIFAAEVELELLRSPWTRVKQFIEATKL